MYWGFSEAEGIRMIQNEAGDSPRVNMAGEYPNKAGIEMGTSSADLPLSIGFRWIIELFYNCWASPIWISWQMLVNYKL